MGGSASGAYAAYRAAHPRSEACARSLANAYQRVDAFGEGEPCWQHHPQLIAFVFIVDGQCEGYGS